LHWRSNRSIKEVATNPNASASAPPFVLRVFPSSSRRELASFACASALQKLPVRAGEGIRERIRFTDHHR
jgi:hypothetical protein